MAFSGTHDFALVVLSVLIAMTASYTALDLGGRIQAATGRAGYVWLLSAAIAMGGGIWSMHFVAMLAFSLPGLEVSYDVGLTLLSLILPVVVTAIGFFVVRRQKAGRLAHMTSGILMGLGIVAMHYTGMAAMRMPASLSYDPVFVALSVAIAIGASVAALWLAFRNTDLVQRLMASVIMGLAISGMHYTAMHAASFHAHMPMGSPERSIGIGQFQLALSVSAATFLILLLALVATIFDRRFAMLATREAAALRESERRFRLLVESVTEYAIVLLDPQGRITNWNSGAERLKGYRADEIVGRHFSCFYSEEDRRNGKPERALESALRQGNHKDEGWRVRKDGSRFWASAVIDAIYEGGTQLLGFAKVIRDMTERKEAQRQVEEAEAKFLQAQKMEAIGQLTGGIAHDFNNLLNAVLGNLELLLRRVPPNPSITPLLENAFKGAQRGAALTQRMLAFARRQDLNPQAVDIPDLLRGMADLLKRTIGPRIRIETRFPVPLARAHVDGHQLELAILNLSVNARDAMPDGGSITIAASEETVGEDNPLGLAPRPYILLQVTDTGAGMDEATLQRALEPFFTTKERGQGTGLGLSIVHGLAEQSGGRLVLKSKRGEGTSAAIWLPVSGLDLRRQAQATAPPTGIGSERASRRFSVLVVDDDDLVLTLAAEMLSDLGHTALQAQSGEAALALLHEGRKVDVVVTDQVMPGMTGVELSAQIKSKWPHISIILASGYAELAARPDPALLKLSKPFSQAMQARALAECAKPMAPRKAVLAFKHR
ncbi:MAG: MHYT domain-containing protein [Xanthobacteraceae bacterium]